MESVISSTINNFSSFITGGEFDDNSSDVGAQLFMLGGDSSDITYVGGENLTYYYMLRLEELQNLKKKVVSGISIDNDISSLYPKSLLENQSLTIYDIYKNIIDISGMSFRLQSQIEETITCLKNLEEYLSVVIPAWLRKSCKNGLRDACISIPEYFISTDIPNDTKYDPILLKEVVNTICKHINDINIGVGHGGQNVITKTSSGDCATIEEFKFSGNVPDMRTQINTSYKNNQIQNLLQIINIEISLGDYLLEIEKYQLSVIKLLNNVFETCKKIRNSGVYK